MQCVNGINAVGGIDGKTKLAIKGKLIGALLGSFAGPMGTILGGLVGHLFDRATEDKEGWGRFIEGFPRSNRDPRTEVDDISTAQLNFLSSLIGLSVAVANADGHVRVSQMEALKTIFRDSFPYSGDDLRIIQGIIDETFLNRHRLNLAGLCAYYRSTSSLAGRLLLLRLLFKIAAADRMGISREEEGMIQRVAVLLGVEGSNYKSIQAEFVQTTGNAYQTLGITATAAESEIRSAYRKLAAQYHPDKVINLGEEFAKVAEEKFKLISQAYDEIRRERGF